jgi:hypothetical protein
MSDAWITARCPACGGGSSLFVAEGGFVTCARLDCPDPEAAHKALEAAGSDLVRKHPAQTAARASVTDRSGGRLTP